jgi:hypothetical protein
LVDEGVAAYRELDFPAAVHLLRRSLESPVPQTDRTRALTYLGAAATLLGDRATAASAFRDLVIATPWTMLDTLTFPPQVTSLFREVRETTKAAAIRVPARATFVVRREALPVVLLVSSPQRVRVQIVDAGNSPVRALLDTTVRDSALVRWDGLDERGSPLATGSYTLRAESMVVQGRPLRTVIVPLEVSVRRPDPFPVPGLPESELRPERAGAAGAAWLIPAAVVGTALWAPAAFGDAQPAAPRIVLGAAITVGGGLAFWKHRPGRTIPTNVAHNDSVRTAWEAQVRQVERANAERQGAVHLDVRAGPARRVETP